MLPDIQVATIKSGDGVHFPTPGVVVNCHYCAFLTDGTKFDSSRDRGRPLRFKVGAEAVIPGLDLAVARLTIGERAKINVPAILAYGPKGFPGRVPANADLIFDLELISF
jgi:FKBP-type peptidyl-prolyl cis-trans isomerase